MTEGSAAATAPTHVASADGTHIAVFSSGAAGRPLILVHGTAGDHTTFRVVGPLFGKHHAVHAIDRRGRGGSGDRFPYSIEREFEDVAAVAETVAAESGDAVDLVGHSYGGRCALGAALRTDAIRRVVCYEGAPTPPGSSYHPDGIERRLAQRLAAGDPGGALEAFMAEVVGMSPADVAAYRDNPVWRDRVAAAGTIPRELGAEASPAASLEALGRVRQPVLQVLGSASLPVFRDATIALDERLVDGRVVVIEGARHAAHHTHPDAFVAAVESFLS
jgi:pimeloyl-ACP methyl ester carboxylesterase